MSQPTSPWPAASLAMTGFTILAFGVSIAGRVLSPSLVLDLVALWPMLILAIPGIVAAVLRPGSRLAGSGPVMLLSWLLLGLALHLAAWGPLPSSAADVLAPVGGEADAAVVSFTLDEGRATLREGREFAVSLERIGGRTGAPTVEVAGADPVLFAIAATESGGWFRFGGVVVDLPPGPSWTVDVSAPVVDIDLSALTVDSVDVQAGAGSVVLGRPDGPTSVRIVGPLRVVVPEGVPASVTGPARVPEVWVSDGEGFRTADDGSGWIIEVGSSGGSVSITNP